MPFCIFNYLIIKHNQNKELSCIDLNKYAETASAQLKAYYVFFDRLSEKRRKKSADTYRIGRFFNSATGKAQKA